jgi:hypothetical protein
MTRNVRLFSRVWVPAQSRLNTNDGRRLGGAIARLRLDGYEARLDSPKLFAGWHAPEGNWRWADGDAHIALNGARELAFDVVITGSYWHDEENDTARAA